MKCFNTGFAFLLLIGVFASCEPQENHAELPSDTPHILRPGKILPAKGKPIHSDSFFGQARRVPIRKKPKVVPAYNNTVPAGKSNFIQISENLPVIIPGQNGVPLPQTLTAQGKVVPAIQPKVVAAKPFNRKETARTNMLHLSIAQGMNHAQVRSMMEDKQGNLWIGTTGGGVSRFDGQQFAHYTTREGLSRNRIECILEDRNGNLWFGTLGGGVNRFDGRQFVQYTNEEGLNGTNVWAILEDKKGTLWFGTNNGVSRFEPDINGTGGRFTHYAPGAGLNGNDVRAIFEDKEGSLWFGTNNGVSRFEPDETGNGGKFIHYTTEEGLSSNNVRAILMDRQGKLWFGTSMGLNRFEPDENGRGGQMIHFTKEMGLIDNNIRSIMEDQNGLLWISTAVGACYFDPNGIMVGGDLTHFGMEDGLVGSTNSIIEGNKGNIWMGTSEGVIRYSPKRHISYHRPNEKQIPVSVRTIYEDRQGNVWFGTKGRGIRYTPPKSRGEAGFFTHFTESEGLSGSTILTIQEDRQGNIWFGGKDLARYRAGSTSAQDETGGYLVLYPDYSGSTIESILLDQSGQLWLGARQGLTHFDPGKQETRESITHYAKEEGLISKTVRSLREDRSGNIWVGTYEGGGVNRYDGRSFAHYNQEKILVAGTIHDMLEDSQGNVWFATLGGASRYKPADSTFYTYTTKDGLIDNRVRSLVEDQQQRIWLNTVNGFSLLVPRNPPSPDAKDAYEIFNFGETDGFITSNIGRKGLCIDQRNQLWWVTGEAIAMLDLTQFELPHDTPGVRLNSLEISQVNIDYGRLGDSSYRSSLPFGESLAGSFDSTVSFYNYPLNPVLPFDLNHLTFHFSAIDWNFPQQLQYSYRMEGLDDTWSPLSAENKADYRNLPPGDYSFHVKANGASHKWSEVFEYEFQILPPWWQRGWAYAFYLLLLAGAIWTFIRWRLYYLRLHYERETALAAEASAREANEAKSTFLSTVSHELRTPLTSVIGFAKLNKKRLEDRIFPHTDTSEKKVARAVEQVSGNNEVIISEGERLTSLINELLDLAKIESGKVDWKMGELHPADLIERAVNATSALFAQKQGVELMTEVPENLPMIIGDKDRLLQVLINLISNAVKFTDSGEVKIGVNIPQLNSPPLQRGAHEAGEVREGPFEGAAASASGDVLFSVKDTGSGIPADQFDKVFERFQQVEDNQAGKPKGTGLGLPICKQIVEHHGGKIWGESEMGRGSTFYFSLPQ